MVPPTRKGDPTPVLLQAATRVAFWIRLRRGAYYGVRALTWGLILAVLPLAAKALLGASAIFVAAGLVIFFLVAGIVSGLVRKVLSVDALRLADRALGLEDRLATALECLERGTRSPIVQALADDAAGKASAVRGREVVSWKWPREIRILPLPVAAALALLLLPPLPIRTAGVPFLGRQNAGFHEEARAERPEQTPREKNRGRSEFAPQYRDTPSEAARRDDSKNPSHLFVDTAQGQSQPDLDEFLRLGDDRLKILERPDKLPDFRSDFTPRAQRALGREMQSLAQGPSDQLSSARLRQILEELERLGRKNDETYQEDLMEGDEALDEGQSGKALSAMQRALNWLRSKDEGERGKKGLQRAPEDGEGEPEDGSEDGEEVGKGSMPGRGRGPLARGNPTHRLGGPKVDMDLEGQAGSGRREAFSLRLPQHPSSKRAEVPYDADVLAQYRRVMEETLVKEAIPFEHRTRIRQYFQSLGEH